MGTRVVNYKGYVIRSEEGEEKGLFWRNPLQKVGYDAYYPEAMFSAWDYLDKIKKPLYRFFQIVLGNRKVLKNIEEWSNSCDWGGFNANILCSPIYFKRNYRKLTAILVRILILLKFILMGTKVNLTNVQELAVRNIQYLYFLTVRK